MVNPLGKAVFGTSLKKLIKINIHSAVLTVQSYTE